MATSATYIRRQLLPDLVTEIAYVAEDLTSAGAIAVGQVVVWAGAKQVGAAGMVAGLLTIAGVAVTAVGGAGKIVTVARMGRAYAKADAGIVAGNLVVTSGVVAGNVAAGVAAIGNLVGRATEATGATIAGMVEVDVRLG